MQIATHFVDADLVIVDESIANGGADEFDTLLRTARSAGAAIIVLETIGPWGARTTEVSVRAAARAGATYLSQEKALDGALERRDIAPSDLLTPDGRSTEADGMIIGRLITDQLQAALNASMI
ncbi:hypothetical protein DF163_14260 [Burkholderia stagnalis]|nr:hypothetical protein DF163_14260 [Burkholderia stagnalis]RQY01136.1 hypothetical protein DF119_09080 [Burkholderia stagnalis]